MTKIIEQIEKNENLTLDLNEFPHCVKKTINIQLAQRYRKKGCV